MPTYLLNSLLDGLEVLLENPGQIENLEAGHDEIFLYRTIVDVVLQLLAVRELIKNPKHSNSFAFSDSELIEGMELYHMNLSFESIRRRTKMEVSFPTLENLLDVNSQRTVTFPDEAIDLIKSQLKPE
ncbi:hypothetical protein [Marinobacter segnicrescens]|uniref:hypothetical protein n=1 Tax=Marinobacter segnicrescens TaxID=430453 RepID=UPI003A8D6B87